MVRAYYVPMYSFFEPRFTFLKIIKISKNSILISVFYFDAWNCVVLFNAFKSVFSTAKKGMVCTDSRKLTLLFFNISYTWCKSLVTSGRMAGPRVYCIRKLHQLGIQKWPWPYLCVWFKYQSDINYLQFVLQITQGRFLGTV